MWLEHPPPPMKLGLPAQMHGLPEEAEAPRPWPPKGTSLSRAHAEATRGRPQHRPEMARLRGNQRALNWQLGTSEPAGQPLTSVSHHALS